MADVLGSQKTSQGAMGKDKIVMPATSLGRKGNEGKALTNVAHHLASHTTWRAT
jgi:hypothetical protein